MFLCSCENLNVDENDSYNDEISNLSKSTSIYTDPDISTIKSILDNNIEYFNFIYDDDYTLETNFENDYTIYLDLSSISYSETLKDSIDIPYEIKKYGFVVYSDVVSYNFSDSNTGAILLSFDDYYSTWDDYIEIFSDKNITATFYCYGWLSRVKSFCKKAQAAGLEVGYHTFHHKNLWETDTEEEVLEEAVNPLAIFKDNYIYFYSFAFPNGVYQPYQIELLLKYYRVLRLFDKNFRLYSLEDMAEQRVFYSQSIDANKFTDDADFKNTMFKRLLLTKLTNKVYPCTTHYIGEKSDGYNITSENLIWLLDTINSMNIKSYNCKNIYNAMYTY